MDQKDKLEQENTPVEHFQAVFDQYGNKLKAELEFSSNDENEDELQRQSNQFTENEEEEALRQKLTVPAENLEEPLYVSEPLQTERVMVKDEDVCLHCGLCAERCPTSAWDMQKYSYHTAKAGAEQESPALRA